jgi:hypothetical protein
MVGAEKDRETLSAQARIIRKMISAEKERDRGSYGIQGQKEHSNLSFRGIFTILIQLRKTGRTDSIVHTVNVQWCREVKVSFSHINLPGQSTIFPFPYTFCPECTMLFAFRHIPGFVNKRKDTLLF